MKRKLVILALVSVLGLAGCGQAVPDGPEPVTVDQWKALPLGQKYTSEAFERLKEGNPDLQTPEGWEAFSRTTLMPARRRDFSRSRR
jgi:ABC-type glycerol-3-phosphate transport system substrate-binding protein